MSIEPTIFSNIIAKIVIPLFKGVLYRDRQEELWQSLLNKQAAVRDYVTVIGLELLIDEAEGYAFLRQRTVEEDNEGESTMPRLIQRRALSYPVSLLCILLRKKLLEQDTSSSDTRVILTQEQIIDMMSVYLPERNNQVKLVQHINSCIEKMLDLGFLRRLKSNENRYEICRIIKALINADWLTMIDHKLTEYLAYANTDTTT